MPTPTATTRRRHLGWALALVMLTVAFYWPAHRFEFINYDDTLYVTENAPVQRGLESLGWAFAPSSIVAANWHPVTMVSHLVDTQLYGLEAGGHHASSVALHAFNTMLVFLILCRLGATALAAGLAAAAFALHPVNVQSVAWIAERKNVLSTTFWLLAVLVYCGDATMTRRRLLLVGVWTVLGLLSKPMLVTLPFTLLLLDAGTRGRRPAVSWRQLWAEKTPLLGLVAAFSLLTLRVQSAGHAVQGIPLGLRTQNALASYGGYLKDLFWPGPRSIFQPHPGVDVALASAVGGAVLVLGISAGLWRFRRHAVGAWIGWLWFLGTLVPVLGLIQVGDQARADRYLYVPALGILGGLIALGARLPRRGQRGALTIGGILVLALGWSARGELAVWRDSETLFRHALAQNEANYLAHNNLATAILEDGNQAEALHHYRRSTQLNPNWGVSHMNLGIVYLQANQPDQAEPELQWALRLRPNWAEALSNLGAAYMLQRRFDLAIQQLERAVQLDPSLAQARSNLERARQYRAGQSP